MIKVKKSCVQTNSVELATPEHTSNEESITSPLPAAAAAAATAAVVRDEGDDKAEPQVTAGHPQPAQDVVADTELTGTDTTTADNLTNVEYVSFEVNDDAMQSERPKSIGKIKHERNMASTNNVVNAILKAVEDGKSEVQIHDIANETAAKTYRSYSNVLSKNSNNTNKKKSSNPDITIAATQQRNNGQQSTDHRQQHQKSTHSGPRNRHNSDHNGKRGKLPKFAQYKKGTNQAIGIDIAAEKPKYMEHKCIVVSRVKRETTIPQIQDYINKIANKNVKFLHSPVNIAKDYSEWRTLAIELSNEDYNILSNPNLWSAKLRIKDFVGRRFWRNKASNISANERRSTVNQSWM